ncbi:plasminogen-like [Amphiura filiformis]|uniref:plasminogen-like n=1 Tax=Amphiura filiformis TaxID=82378 RepID=UPI003B20F4B2
MKLLVILCLFAVVHVAASTESECYSDALGQDYRGSVHRTKDCKECQSWTSQDPHAHTRTPANYPDAGLGEHNYCRNPDDEPNGPWCYTTDPETRWAYCPVYDCASECYSKPHGGDYRGSVNQTTDCKECQSWTSQDPHAHTRTPENYPDAGLGEHNYCRNPDDEPNGPWCYTTDPETRWAYCPVPNCATFFNNLWNISKDMYSTS